MFNLDFTINATVLDFKNFTEELKINSSKDKYKIAAVYRDGELIKSSDDIPELEAEFDDYELRLNSKITIKPFVFPDLVSNEIKSIGYRIINDKNIRTTEIMDNKETDEILQQYEFFNFFDNTYTTNNNQDIESIALKNNFNIWHIPTPNSGGDFHRILKVNSSYLAIFEDRKNILLQLLPNFTEVDYLTPQQNLPTYPQLIFNTEPAFGTRLRYASFKYLSDEKALDCCPSVLESLGYNREFVLNELAMRDSISDTVFKLTDSTYVAPENRGCLPSKVIKFCFKHNHSYYIVDQNDDLLTHWVGTDPTHKKALFVMFGANHIELITDQTKRNQIRERAKPKKEIKDVYLSEKKSKCSYCEFETDKSSLLFIHDIENHKEERGSYYENSLSSISDIIENEMNVNIRTDESLYDIFIHIIRTQKIVGKLSFTGSKPNMLYYDDRNIYVYESDQETEMKLCESLGLPYQHQTIPMIASEYLEKTITVNYKSLPEEELSSIMEQSPTALVGDFTTKYSKSSKISIFEIDFTKQYSYILMNYDMPQLSPISYVRPFDINEKIKPTNIYFIKVHDHYLLDHPFITGHTVDFVVNNNILDKANIYAVCDTNVISKDKLGAIFRDFYTKSDEGKKLANYANGCFKNSDKTSYSNPIVTNSLAEATYYRRLDDGHVEQVGFKEKHGEDMWVVLKRKTIKSRRNATPIYNTVVEIGRLRMYMLQKFIESFGGVPLQAKTDAIIFETELKESDINKLISTANIIYKDDFGKMKNVTKAKFLAFDKPVFIKQKYPPISLSYWGKQANYYKLTNNEDFDLNILINHTNQHECIMIQGDGGTGKSEIIKSYKEYADKNNIRYAAVAFTNTAANNIGGRTLHNIFQIDIKNQTVLESKIKKFTESYDVVIVDEISMIPSFLYSVLNLIKKTKPTMSIFLFGDWYQIKPVREEHMEFKNNPSVLALHNYNTLELTKNYRLASAKNSESAEKFMQYNRDAVRGNRNYELSDFGSKRVFYFDTPEMYKTDINLVYTNRMRHIINSLYLQKLYNGSKNIINGIAIEVGFPIICENKIRFSLNFNPYNYNFNIIDGTFSLKTGIIETDDTIYKNEHYVIKSINGENIEISTNSQLAYDRMGVKTIKTFQISKDTLIKNFCAGFAFTIHKTQSLSIPTTINIHEFEKMKIRPDGKNLIYTALGRLKDPENIRIIIESDNQLSLDDVEVYDDSAPDSWMDSFDILVD